MNELRIRLHPFRRRWEWGEIYLMNNLGGSSAYEEAWAYIEAIYRRPPEGKL